MIVLAPLNLVVFVRSFFTILDVGEQRVHKANAQPS